MAVKYTLAVAMASKLHYLTVQDVLWINLEATRRRNGFSYATLEEATYYQYAYGESDELTPQAAKFVSGFLKLHPFEAGNQVTAFVGLVAFLRANNATLDLEDAGGLTWFERVAQSHRSARDAVSQSVRPNRHDGHHADVDMRSCVRGVFADFPETIRALSARG